MPKDWVVKASALEVAEAQQAAEKAEDWALSDFWGHVLMERLDKLDAIESDYGTATGANG